MTTRSSPRRTATADPVPIWSFADAVERLRDPFAIEDLAHPPAPVRPFVVDLRGLRPPVPEADRAVEEDAVAVRAAVDQLVVHGLQEVTVVMTVETDDPAHRQLLVLRSGGRAGARRR